jgi:hypothetical protein
MAESEKHITISVEDLQATFSDIVDEANAMNKFEMFLKTLQIRTARRNAQKDNHERQIKEFYQREALKVD